MSVAGYEVHPAADLFPMLDEDRFASLVASIEANGQRDPVVLFEGKLLDGRNRARACAKLGISPKTISFVGDPWEFVWDKNGERRDLTPGQRAAIRIRFDEHKEIARKVAEDANRKRSEAASARRGEGGRLTSGGSREPRQASAKESKTAQAVAARAKVSTATAKRAIELKRKDSEAFDQVAAGKVDLNKALRTIKQAEARAKVEEAAKQTPERAVVEKAQALEFLKGIKAGSVDLLLTDPPYSTDVDDIRRFATWLPAGLSKLKPTGRAYVCIGAYSRELLAYLETLDLHPGWMERSQVLVWTYRNTIGPSPKDRYKLNWQAILYLWGEEAGSLDCPVMTEQFSVQDINAPDGRQGDRYHAWQKPDELAERFVRHATKPGDLVVDPFAGTGTFLLAAARLGRRAIGCDINPDNLKIAAQRGCVVEKEARYA